MSVYAEINLAPTLSHFLGVPVTHGSAGLAVDAVHGAVVDGRLNGRLQHVEMRNENVDGD